MKERKLVYFKENTTRDYAKRKQIKTETKRLKSLRLLGSFQII